MRAEGELMNWLRGNLKFRPIEPDTDNAGVGKIKTLLMLFFIILYDYSMKTYSVKSQCSSS